MAEGRMLRRKVAHDERVAQLSDRSALLYLMSIPHLDREGRISGLPMALRGQVVPAFVQARPVDWTDALIESYMYEWVATRDEEGHPRPLVRHGCVRGIWVCEFAGFQANQSEKALSREAPSQLPAIPETTVASLPSTQLSLASVLQAASPSTNGAADAGSSPSSDDIASPSTDGAADPHDAAAALLAASPSLSAAAEPSRDERDSSRVRKRSEVKKSEEKSGLTPAPCANNPDDLTALVYEHWRSTRGRSHRRYDRLSNSRRDKIRKRLAEFTAEELCAAIDGIALDPWADRVRHDDLIIVFRSREQVERFLRFHEQGENGSLTRRLTGGQIIERALRSEDEA